MQYIVFPYVSQTPNVKLLSLVFLTFSIYLYKLSIDAMLLLCTLLYYVTCIIFLFYECFWHIETCVCVVCPNGYGSCEKLVVINNNCSFG